MLVGNVDPAVHKSNIRISAYGAGKRFQGDVQVRLHKMLSKALSLFDFKVAARALDLFRIVHVSLINMVGKSGLISEDFATVFALISLISVVSWQVLRPFYRMFGSNVQFDCRVVPESLATDGAGKRLGALTSVFLGLQR